MRALRSAVAAAAGTAVCLCVSAPAFAAATWQVVPSADTANTVGQDELAGAAIVSTGEAWAVGDTHTVVNGVAQQLPLIEHYTGNSWQLVSSPAPVGFPFVYLTSVAVVATTNAWAVGEDFTADHLRNGHPVVEHYDGSAWTLVTVPQVDPVAGFTSVAATSASDVWAVGGTGSHPKSGPSTRFPLVEHYDGTTWSIAATPSLSGASLGGVAAVSPTDVWAVGTQSTTGFVLHFDGVSWAQMPLPAPAVATNGWSLTDVAAAPSGRAWAIGSYTATDGSQHALVATFDGASWSTTPLPDPATGMVYTSLTSVAAASDTDVWIVGDTSAGNQAHTTYLEHFDGTGWRVVPNPHVNTNDTLSGLATNGSVAWAVGSTGTAGGSTWQTLTERYA